VLPCSIVSVAFDDGTARYSLVTPEVVITHTGLSGNVRILVAASERLAVQHKYAFDEYIDITIFFSYLVCSRNTL
jgi:20S proteasome alpha/beta subunit